MLQLICHLFGDYVLQSDWMAQRKTSESAPAALHAALYALCFLPVTRSLAALMVIGGTHFAIDRFRLARYVVWAKNALAPQAWRYPLAECPTGYHQDRPAWLSVWLLIAADNALHLAINAAAVAAFGAA